MIKCDRKEIFCLGNLFFKVYNSNSWSVPVMNTMGQIHFLVIVAMLVTW